MHVPEELYLKQFAYEEEADTRAAVQRLEELRKGSADGDAELPRASKLIARLYGTVQSELEVVCATRTNGLGGKYKGWLRAIPLDVASVIAIRECISMCSSADRPVILQNLAISIAKLWEMELRIREAEKVNPVYMQRIHDQVRERGTQSVSHLRKLYNTAYTAVMKGVIDSSMTAAERLQLGKFGVQACLDAGLLESRRAHAKKGTLVQFTLSPEFREILTGYTDKDVQNVIDRTAGAMLCTPAPWTTLADGGYLTPRRKFAAPLLDIRSIRQSEKVRLRKEFTAEKMPLVFAAGNYMQERAFRVHSPTLNAIRRVWQAGGGVLGVPDKGGPRRPECPVPEDWVKADAHPDEVEAFTDWKRKAALYYDALKTWRGKVREISGFLRVVENNGDVPVWFPMFADKRGRWYYRGTPNPQGSDLAKSVLHFDNKRALGHRGLFWLKVHIANAFGFDKERFVDRAVWTDQHWADIERALEEPENHTDVWGTDAPWCMYSAAWELREAYRSGNPLTYQTGVVVHMDATCSGLQHFSALLRDPVGGQYVNLSDEAQCGPKQDIYGKVAHSALQSMQRDLEDLDPVVKAMATWWSGVGIARALAKKPVMTYVYGATLRGTTDFVRNYVEEELKLEWPDKKQSYLYSQYAAKKLFKGIAATVPSSEYTMHWLQGVAGDQIKGKRMEWKSPTGFLVQHDYQGFDEIRVTLKSCGLSKVVVRESNEETNGVKMRNAIAPNFVHALDASHLTFTALAMQAQGNDMVGIHDSFGTHPSCVDAMHQCIREAFVGMYQGTNILGNFLMDVDLPREIPMRGNLDISSVLSSEFFFC